MLRFIGRYARIVGYGSQSIVLNADLEKKKMPRKQLVCDYCPTDVDSNNVGLDINQTNVKFTICAKCLKSSFDWIAGRQRRGRNGSKKT